MRLWTWLRAHEILLIISCHVTSVFLNWHMVGPVLPRFALDFGVTIAQVSLLISAFTLARILLNFPAGALAERVGRRNVFLAGGLLVGLASIGPGLVESFPQLVALRLLTGAGGAVAITVQMTILADISTHRTRARVMSANEGVVAVGLFLGPGIGGLLADHVGLRVPFYLAGGLTLLFTLWALLRLPETRGWNAEQAPASPLRGASGDENLPPTPTLTRKGEGGLSPAAWPERKGTSPSPTGLAAGVRTVLSDFNYVMIAVLGFVTFFTRFATLFLMLPILAYGLGMSPGEYGLVASALSLVQIPLLPVSGILADRFGRKPVIVPSTVLTGAAIAAFGLAPTREWFIVVALAYGMVVAVSGPAAAAYLADVAPAQLRGTSMGIYRTFGDVAGFIGPLAVGVLAQLWSEEVAVVANGALVVVVAVIFALFARETGRLISPPRGRV